MLVGNVCSRLRLPVVEPNAQRHPDPVFFVRTHDACARCRGRGGGGPSNPGAGRGGGGSGSGSGEPRVAFSLDNRPTTVKMSGLPASAGEGDVRVHANMAGVVVAAAMLDRPGEAVVKFAERW